MPSRLKKWLVLSRVPSLGTSSIKKLWDHFGSIDKILSASEAELSSIEGLSKKAIKLLVAVNPRINSGEFSFPNSPHFNVGFQPTTRDTKALTFEDKSYPQALLNIYDPPSILYVKGDENLLNQKCIAIVGTRKASHYGKVMARKLAYELAAAGITIVSGLALGIDTAAHEGALEAKGKTVAVLGCGVDVIYPPSNKNLYSRIPTIISEFEPGTEVEGWRFPQRNRIISGLSLGTIVIEGHYKSGAMITAKQALDQGREVFALPGQVDNDQAKGPHWLIKQGAKLVESVEDVLEELGMVMSHEGLPAADYSNLSEDELKIVKMLSLEPKHMDAISLETKLAIPQISGLLMMLEMKKMVRQLPGQKFVLY